MESSLAPLETASLWSFMGGGSSAWAPRPGAGQGGHLSQRGLGRRLAHQGRGQPEGEGQRPAGNAWQVWPFAWLLEASCVVADLEGYLSTLSLLQEMLIKFKI